MISKKNLCLVFLSAVGIATLVFANIQQVHAQTGCVTLGNYTPSLTLCDAIQPSPFGYFWREANPKTINFETCQAFNEWNTTNYLGEARGGLTINSITLISTTLPNKFTFDVQVTPVNSSRISMQKPAWPAMEPFQELQVDQQVIALWGHERGHLNIDGWAAQRISGTYEVQALKKNEAVTLVKNQVKTKIQEARTFGELYDNITAHGQKQDLVGGTPYVPLRCEPALVISPVDLPEATEGNFYSQKFELTSEEPGYEVAKPVSWYYWSGILPTGLSLEETSGILSGTPQSAGTFEFSIKAVDWHMYPATQTFKLVVKNAPVPQITQDEAILSVPILGSGEPTYLNPVWTVRQRWDSGFQSAKGSFINGGAIKSVSISVPQGSNATLVMPGVIRGGTTWLKADNPTLTPETWEIQVAIPEVYASNPWPRYISIGFEGTSGTITINTPLVWWNILTIQESKRTLSAGRWFGCEPAGSQYFSFLEEEYQYVAAEFFFGDGDSRGIDPGYLDWRNGIDSTQVSFIPIGTVKGYEVRATSLACSFPPDWTVVPVNTEYRCDKIDVFASYKNSITIREPNIWNIGATECASSWPPFSVVWDEIYQQWLSKGEPILPTFTTDVYFKRDYLPNELSVFSNLGVEPINYNIHLYTINP